mgnify:CR=1 FL=1
MNELNLFTSLRKLGASKLSGLVGQNRLEAIHAIMQDKVTESQLARILLSRHSSQILANKTIRLSLLHTLTKEHLAYLAQGNEHAVISEKDLAKLEKASWSRTSIYSQRLTEIFGLGVEYLPPIKQQVPCQEMIDADTKLYPYQKGVKDKFIRSLLSNEQRLLIHMPTGSGKTRTTIEGLVDYWRAQGDKEGFMVWLTDSEELCTQAEETFTKFWKLRGDRPINLVRLWGAHKLDKLEESGGLIIASLQKLNLMRTSASNDDFKLINEIKRRNRLIVVDEAHKSIAPTYKATIDFICNQNKTRLIGLTATPGRTNEDQISELVSFYGNRKITVTDEAGKEVSDPIKFLQEDDYLSTLQRKKVPTDITVDLTSVERAGVSKFFEIPPRILLELSNNDQRNALIVREIALLHEQEKQIIVFACSVEHAHLLTELLMLRDIPARSVDGGTLPFDRNQFINEFKSGDISVLVNYGVLTTGFDAPNTNAVVITRPTGSLVLYSQMIGRGIRGPKMGGTPDCILVDMEDNLIGYPSEAQAFKFFDKHWRVA